MKNKIDKNDIELTNETKRHIALLCSDENEKVLEFCRKLIETYILFSFQQSFDEKIENSFNKWSKYLSKSLIKYSGKDE